jgi:hypothetical protein
MQFTDEDIAIFKAQIERHLTQFGDSGKVLEFLALSVGRVLFKHAMAGQVWDRSITTHETRHIRDWLVAAVADDAKWTKRLDLHGRPVKLMKYGKISDITVDADKAMRIAIQKTGRTAAADGDEVTLLRLEDGYSLVRMLSPSALDMESSVMQHCIGNGGYDEHLSDHDILLLSLRDRNGQPHVTFEVHAEENVIVQMQGKQNAKPSAKYWPYIKEIVSSLEMSVDCDELDFAVDMEGEFHDKRFLPEGFATRGDLSVDLIDLSHLPGNLHVGGALYAQQSMIKSLPRKFHIGGGLFLFGSSIKRLPRGLVVNGPLDVGSTELRGLPSGLIVRGDLKINGTDFEELPRDLVFDGGLLASGAKIRSLSHLSRIGGDLLLQKSHVTALADNLEVLGNLSLCDTLISRMPSKLTVGRHLILRNTHVKELPEGLVVRGTLNLSETKVVVLPGNMSVGNLDLSKSNIAVLPPSLSVSGDLYMNSLVSEIPEGVVVEGDVVMLGHRYSLDDARAALRAASSTTSFNLR